jgi:hypothetical protein
MLKLKVQERAKIWLVAAFMVIGIVMGYVNFRIGLRGIFTMANGEGIRTLTVILGGYVSLLPLTLLAPILKRISPLILLFGTAVAFAIGFLPFGIESTAFMLGHFVLPNVLVAGLMIRTYGATGRRSKTQTTGKYTGT